MSAFFAAPGGDAFDEFLARYLQGQRAQAGRPIDISRFLSRRTQHVLNQAGQFAYSLGHTEVDALHLLRVLAEEPHVSEIIAATGATPRDLAGAVESRLPGASEERLESAPTPTAALHRSLFDAFQIARVSGSTYIDPEHLFYALVVNTAAPTGQLLSSVGITPHGLQEAAARYQEKGGPAGAGTTTTETAASGTGTPMLDQYGVDLTALAREGRLDPVIGRDGEIEQTVEILSRRTKNNPVLIGEAGVGKTAVVEGLAQAIVAGDVPDLLHGKRVVALDLPGMLAGTRYRGDFEERLTTVLTEIADHSEELIVFIDELHTLVGAGGAGEGMDAGNILKPRLARGELHVVGATTLKEYRVIEKDAALERRFQPVQVGEPSVEDAVRILSGLRGRYEQHHGVTYTDEAIRAAVELSARYLPDRFLPDKAIDLIDQAGARQRLRRRDPQDRARLDERRLSLEAQKDAAVATEDYELAARLKEEIAELNARLAAPEPGTAEPSIVDEDQIAEVIARASGIPVQRITEGERSRLAGLEEQLHRRVVGQDEAVTAVARAVRRNRTGLGDGNRPVGSFLFLGPTGVGKTELAKSLADALFGRETAMLRFDMSEYGERHTVSRLVGAPPGYVGYSDAGQLTEQVRRNPYSVVLFDEIEKAHPDIFNLLLQVLDDGRLTDGQGRTVDFRNTLVIMTSNLGSEFLASRGGPMGFVAGGGEGEYGSEAAVRDRVMGKLREEMRPEFLNRIDEIVMFRKLDRKQLRTIVGLLLEQTRERLAAQDIGLTVTDEATDWFAEHGYEPQFGARPLRRLIQRELGDRAAELMLEGAGLGGGDAILVTVHDGRLVVRAQPAAAVAA